MPPTTELLRPLSRAVRCFEVLRHGPSALKAGRDLRAARASLARSGSERFADLERYVLFVGYPRSAHSLVGSIVDGHPDAVVAHEEDALRYVARGATREEIFDRLLANSAAMAADGRVWTGYSYELPGQHQGSARRLRVVGDKKGAQTTRRLGVRPELLDRLRATVRLPLRVVHVVRDPRDNIATMAYRSRGSRDEHVRPADLVMAARRWFWLRDTVRRTLERLGEDEHLTMHVDDLTRDARGELARLMAFLGLEAGEAFLAAARELVRERPNRSSERFAWPAQLAGEIRRRMAADHCLERYSDRPADLAGRES